MTRDAKESLDRIKQELIHLYKRWLIYKQLYATNHYRIDILNSVTPYLFAEFQSLLMDNIFFALSRLTDPSYSGINRDYSLFYLLEQIRKTHDVELYDELVMILSEIERAMKSIHKLKSEEGYGVDRAVVLNDKNAPLSGISGGDITRVLSLIMNFLNLIEYRYLRSVTRYDMISLPEDSDGRALIVWLKRALEVQ